MPKWRRRGFCGHTRIPEVERHGRRYRQESHVPFAAEDDRCHDESELRRIRRRAKFQADIRNVKWRAGPAERDAQPHHPPHPASANKTVGAARQEKPNTVTQLQVPQVRRMAKMM